MLPAALGRINWISVVLTVSPLGGANLIKKTSKIVEHCLLEKAVKIVREATFADRGLHDLLTGSSLFTRSHHLVTIRKSAEREGCSCNSPPMLFQQSRLFIEIVDLPPGTMYVT